MPIKSFLGHRSQASPEIRHISGQNIKEFTEFLQRHDHIFAMRDNYVVLRSVLDKVDENGKHTKIKRVLEETPTDPYLMQQLVQQLEEAILHLGSANLSNNKNSCCASNGAISDESGSTNKENIAHNQAGSKLNRFNCGLVCIEQLFGHMRSVQQSDLFSRMINSTSDLCTMLKMNSKIFHVHSNKVAITDERLNRLGTNPCKLDKFDQYSNFANKTNSCSTSLSPPASLSPPNGSTCNPANFIEYIPPVSLTAPHLRPASAAGMTGSCVTNSRQPRVQSKTINANSKGIPLDRMQLPELSPAFSTPNLTSPAAIHFGHHPVPLGLPVPAHLHHPHPHHRVAHIPMPINSPMMIMNGGSHGYLNQMGSQPHLLTTPIPLRPGLHPRYVPCPPPPTTVPLPPPPSTVSQPPPVHPSNQVSLETKVLQCIQIVTRNCDADQFVQNVINNNFCVAVDMKGVNLSATGQVTVVQISVFNDIVSIPARVFLFDVILNPDLLYRSLKRLFECESVVKVFNDCRNASAALHSRFGIELRNVFNIQAAHSVLDQQNNGRPVYETRFIQMHKLCETHQIVVGAPSECKQNLKRNSRKDNQYWTHRPFTDEMLLQAAYEISVLLPQLYLKMLKEIRTPYYPLLQQLNEEAVWAQIKPDEVKTKRKHRKTEMEVTNLKRRLFNTDARHIVLSNREIRYLR